MDEHDNRLNGLTAQWIAATAIRRREASNIIAPPTATTANPLGSGAHHGFDQSLDFEFKQPRSRKERKGRHEEIHS
jgi:hypothetical protein